MATRGHLGGLARATGEVALVLDAAGKDVVLIETVGVGQDEVDIVRTADVSIVTVVPGTGDEVQALKAGIMEIARHLRREQGRPRRRGSDRRAVEAMLSLNHFAARRLAAADPEDGSDDGRRASTELVDAIDRFRAAHRDVAGRAPAGTGASSGCASCWAHRFLQHVEHSVLGAGRARALSGSHRAPRARSVHGGGRDS